jgi:hypothetical protein
VKRRDDVGTWEVSLDTQRSVTRPLHL